MIETGRTYDVRRNPKTGREEIVSNYVGKGNTSPNKVGKVLSNGMNTKTLETAFVNSGIFGGPYSASNSVSFTAISTAATRYITLLEGLLPEEEYLMRQYYKDIYLYDSIAGSAVDMMSTLPFSDFSLSGLDDSMLDTYNTAIERLNLRTIFPSMAVDYLVFGAFISTLVFRNSDRIFTDLIPYDMGQCTFEEMPIYGLDPLITVSLDNRMLNFLGSNDPYIRQVRARLSPGLLRAFQSGAARLDPITTIFVPRRTSTSIGPVSWIRRLIPIYLIEKVLYRGTYSEAARRQRGSLHVTAGTPDWEPTPTELDSITALFQQADFDPLGAIITTRQGVEMQEFRQGGEFWKWTDVAMTTAGMKLNALGINSAFMSGDTTVSNMEGALSVFTENMASFRQFVSQKFFNEKLFPIIATVNGFIDEKKAPKGIQNKTAVYDGSYENSAQYMELLENPNWLKMPQVIWHKDLSPKKDFSFLETLQQLTTQGVPIPLRVWASAGGLSLDSLMAAMPTDLDLRNKLGKMLGVQIPGPIGVPEEGQPQSSGQAISQDQRDMQNQQSDQMENQLAAFNLLGRQPVGLLNRDFGEASEVVGSTKTGKKKYIIGQTEANKRANRMIEKAAKNMSDPNHAAEVKEKVISYNQGRMPSIL